MHARPMTAVALPVVLPLCECRLLLSITPTRFLPELDSCRMNRANKLITRFLEPSTASDGEGLPWAEHRFGDASISNTKEPFMLPSRTDTFVH